MTQEPKNRGTDKKRGKPSIRPLAEKTEMDAALTLFRIKPKAVPDPIRGNDLRLPTSRTHTLYYILGCV